jgi:hypothetical protein
MRIGVRQLVPVLHTQQILMVIPRYTIGCN